MGKTFQKPEVLSDAHTHYCPGCTHGVIHRLVADAIDDLGIRGRTVGIAPVGCAVLAYNYFDCDFQEAAHGRAPAMATGIKRVRPDLIVFTYQGDGDMAAIGTGGRRRRVIGPTRAMAGKDAGTRAGRTCLTTRHRYRFTHADRLFRLFCRCCRRHDSGCPDGRGTAP